MRIRFVLGEIGQGLRRNLSMTVSVILVTFVSLAFVGVASLLQTQIGKMKGDWYDKVEVTVFLCPTDSSATTCASGAVTDAQRADIEKALKAPEVAPLIEKTYFETQDEAYASFQKRFAGQSFASVLTAADMNSSYRIKLTDPTKYQVVADVVSGLPGVEEVQDQRQLFDRLFLVLDRATLLAGGLAVVMLLAAVLLITTTIRLSALSRRRETGIMRLVGASNWFIQLPFVLEGAIAATIGAALAVGALWLGVKYLVTDWLGRSLTGVAYVTTTDVLAVAPVLIAIAIALAALSSLVTVSRYTKV
ncbi:permease-like cell division protein FtsX [Cellulomonas citrea]|uniref:permease-like cell division protein FtsX n=1 Tax=Cellulomonas citrea TaxID=1909423 RepID=UPI001357E5FC|nr:permease-like cell division protein FtsX [Cellulomonas citrea]